ncbi:MAG: hypothetical protein K6G50_04430 [bacterium]|nr:hypothetical protein [bacterium]
MISESSDTDNKANLVGGDVSLKIAADTDVLPKGCYNGTIVCDGKDVKITLEVGPKSTSSEPEQKDVIGINEEGNSANPFTMAADNSITQNCDVSQADSEEPQNVFAQIMAAGDNVSQDNDVLRADSGEPQSISSQADSKNNADTASFSKTKVDFGDVKGLDRVSETITLNGFAKGRITSSDSRWLHVEPSFVDGTDVPVKITVNSSVLPAGYFEGSISYNNSTVTVGVAVEKAEASKFVMGVSLCCLLGSILSILVFFFGDFLAKIPGLSFLASFSLLSNIIFIPASWCIYLLNRRKKQAKILLAFALSILGLCVLCLVIVIVLIVSVFFVASEDVQNYLNDSQPSPAPSTYSTPASQSSLSPVSELVPSAISPDEMYCYYPSLGHISGWPLKENFEAGYPIEHAT